jgi:hypothetical protein
MKIFDEIFDLVRLKDISKRGHSSAAIMNLMLNLCFAKALPHSTQTRPKLSSPAVHSVTMLATLLVKERSARLTPAVRISVNSRCRSSRKATKQGHQGHHEKDTKEDPQTNLGTSSLRHSYLPIMVGRE